ncbi:orotidine-5'-phosphate decarboxylase [Chloracidobacterium validum]|uniref:Orotidine 5'-phosphate decarboxylase n=1 Tax=Chloracidobacterium validum TaxID=2821543 RepID=A0ABX8BA48_9BACT|nr:orotidine-5'-phosphate decarboxylase [Chloracidobacterium validum]QUW03287.1 orotidine-5'-phosphate decarboxylase [Chloracidobacterium validum]
MTSPELSPAARLFVALDTPDPAFAERLVHGLSPYVGGFKIGKTLFTAAGPSIVALALATGARVFLDLKFHDIPNTVAGAVVSAAQLGVHLCTVHTLGGRAMLQAASAALATMPGNAPPMHGARPVILGVTLLTSADQATLDEVGILGTPEQVVSRLTRLAVECGLGGIVCSPHEIPTVRSLVPDDFVIVTPGIRPRSALPDDQRRVATPSDALAAGATYLVIGRPITAAPDPAAAAQRLLDEMTAT